MDRQRLWDRFYRGAISNGEYLKKLGRLATKNPFQFGTEGKLILEYSWDKVEPPKADDIKVETADCATNPENETKDPEAELEGEKPPNDLNLSLQRLLSVAKLHYRKNMIKCPCGHVCGGTAKSSAPAQKQNKSKKDSGMCDKSTQSPEVRLFRNREVSHFLILS